MSLYISENGNHNAQDILSRFTMPLNFNLLISQLGYWAKHIALFFSAFVSQMAAFSHRLKTFLREKRGGVSDPPDVEMGHPAAAAETKQLAYWPFFTAFAIQMAALSDKKLRSIFYFLGLTVMLGFACFFVGRCIRSMFEQAAEVLERVGIFFGVTAIFISITVPFPDLWFKCVTGFVYALCWLTILACNYFH